MSQELKTLIALTLEGPDASNVAHFLTTGMRQIPENIQAPLAKLKQTPGFLPALTAQIRRNNRLS